MILRVTVRSSSGKPGAACDALGPQDCHHATPTHALRPQTEERLRSETLGSAKAPMGLCLLQDLSQKMRAEEQSHEALGRNPAMGFKPFRPGEFIQAADVEIAAPHPPPHPSLRLSPIQGLRKSIRPVSPRKWNCSRCIDSHYMRAFKVTIRALGVLSCNCLKLRNLTEEYG